VLLTEVALNSRAARGGTWGSTSQPCTSCMPSRSKTATSSVNSKLSMPVNRTLTSTPVACVKVICVRKSLNARGPHRLDADKLPLLCLCFSTQHTTQKSTELQIDHA